jgi:hypothetical protein
MLIATQGVRFTFSLGEVDAKNARVEGWVLRGEIPRPLTLDSPYLTPETWMLC